LAEPPTKNSLKSQTANPKIGQSTNFKYGQFGRSMANQCCLPFLQQIYQIYTKFTFI